MDRYLVVNGKFVTHRYGGYVRHDAAKDEIHKRDVEIAALKARIIDNVWHKQATAFPRDGKISIPPIEIPETWREKYIEEE